jgi:hypothetical protein
LGLNHLTVPMGMLPALLHHLGGVDHPASGDAGGKLDCAAQSR